MITAPALMLMAWLLEMAIGWPDRLYRMIRHPVVWIGAAIGWCDRHVNRPHHSHIIRYFAGLVSSLACVGLVAGFVWVIQGALQGHLWGVAVEIVIASSLLASRSLFDHVAAVAQPLSAGDLDAARSAVAMIVGRDPQTLDQAAIARASLESLAENASDGVIAPIFWGCCFGLMGIAVYKTVNTLDSMIGHRTDRHRAFGGFAARLDDLLNLIPARITGCLIALARGTRVAWCIMWLDARHHRSPNAGWPEAAMAGALGIRLSGPRAYGATLADEPWLNPIAPDPSGADVRHGLSIYRRAMAIGAAMLMVLAIWSVRP